MLYNVYFYVSHFGNLVIYLVEYFAVIKNKSGGRPKKRQEIQLWATASKTHLKFISYI